MINYVDQLVNNINADLHIKLWSVIAIQYCSIYVQTDRFVVLELAYMVLNVNIKLFFVENYIFQVELYIGIYL